MHLSELQAQHCYAGRGDTAPFLISVSFMKRHFVASKCAHLYDGTGCRRISRGSRAPSARRIQAQRLGPAYKAPPPPPTHLISGHFSFTHKAPKAISFSPFLKCPEPFSTPSASHWLFLLPGRRLLPLIVSSSPRILRVSAHRSRPPGRLPGRSLVAIPLTCSPLDVLSPDTHFPFSAALRFRSRGHL